MGLAFGLTPALCEEKKFRCGRDVWSFPVFFPCPVQRYKLRGNVVAEIVAAAFKHALIRRTRQNPLHARKIRWQFLAAGCLPALFVHSQLYTDAKITLGVITLEPGAAPVGIAVTEKN